MRIINITIAVVLTAILAACGQESTHDHANHEDHILNGAIKIDGSSTVFPISEAVAEEFRAVQPKVRVSIGVSGTGGGFKKFVAGDIDINNASRHIKEGEKEKAKAANIDYLELAVAYDGLSIIVNKDNDFVDYITVAELKKIWEPGSTVSKWSQVRDEWPDKEIKLYGPGADSGTFDYFTKAINGKEGASRPDYAASEDDNVIVNGVSGDLYSLGFFGFAYYEANKDKLKIVPVDGGKGPIAPTVTTINNGTYAPLSRPVFIYVSVPSLAEETVQVFVKFYIDNAADLAQQVGYIPLPVSEYSDVKSRLEKQLTQNK
jgi:phosphate transport system substrate-binding protein